MRSDSVGGMNAVELGVVNGAVIVRKIGRGVACSDERDHDDYHIAPPMASAMPESAPSATTATVQTTPSAKPIRP
jgi:hypothetical protein